MPRIAGRNDYTTSERATQHDVLMPLLEAMWHDFQELTKKKADATLNKRKVTIVNRLLTDVFAVLDDEPSRQFLDLLDEDDLPQNSDVLLILHQTVSAMQAFSKKYKYFDRDARENVWALLEEAAPARSKKRT